jgi:cation diffusion facilitator CzcD-associated flavoprotein CzcO
MVSVSDQKNPMATHLRVAVIGAGVAGLPAAYFLQRR